MGTSLPFIRGGTAVPDSSNPGIPGRLNLLIDQVSKQYRVDPKRIYVTGLSMGGFGSIALAATSPDRIAAMASLSGGYNPEIASRLKTMPTWLFHGDADTVVPTRYSVDLAHTMQVEGAPVKLTIYPGVGHWGWEQNLCRSRALRVAAAAIQMKIAVLCRFYWEEHRRFAANGNGPVQQLAEAVAALGARGGGAQPGAGNFPNWRNRRSARWKSGLSPRDKKRDFFTGLRDKWAKQTYRHRKVYTDAYALRDFLAQRGPFDVLWAQTEEPDGLVAAIAAQQGVKLPPVVTQIQALRYKFEKGEPIFNEKPALRISFQGTRIAF